MFSSLFLLSGVRRFWAAGLGFRACLCPHNTTYTIVRAFVCVVGLWGTLWQHSVVTHLVSEVLALKSNTFVRPISTQLILKHSCDLPLHHTPLRRTPGTNIHPAQISICMSVNGPLREDTDHTMEYKNSFPNDSYCYYP